MGGLYLEGRFNRGFFALRFLGGLYLEGLVHGGAYFCNFTVTVSILPEVMYHLVKDSVKGIDQQRMILL